MTRGYIAKVSDNLLTIKGKVMNIYLITQTKVTGYDTYDAAVVAALDAENARGVHPSGNQNQWGASIPTWCPSPADVSVKLVGTTDAFTKAGVVLASFNAG